MIWCFPSQKLNTSSLKKIKERHINKCPTKSSSFPRFFFLSPGVQFDKPANINASIKLFHSQNRSRIPPNIRSLSFWMLLKLPTTIYQINVHHISSHQLITYLMILDNYRIFLLYTWHHSISVAIVKHLIQSCINCRCNHKCIDIKRK